MRIAIVGAGLSGLCCAAALRGAGHAVTLFEKSRGVGGRLSTRRVTLDGIEVGFDHGAQYMTARDPAFLDLVRRWQAAGVAAAWPAAGEDAWVGVPGMNAPARHLADGLDIRRGHLVTALQRRADGWTVRIGGSDADPAPEAAAEPPGEPFGAVIVALPAEQAAILLAPIAADWGRLAADTPSSPCWTVMASFADRLPIRADTVSGQAPIGWAARNSAKPGRGGPEAWVIQADPDWSATELEQAPAEVAARLLEAFRRTLGIALPEVTHLSAHRWRYAKSGSAQRFALWDPSRRLGVCGDWLIGPRVENAFASGTVLAAAIGSGD